MDPLSDEQIKKIEEAIGLSFPDDVRDQFHLSNGIQGPTGCNLLAPWNPSDSRDIIHLNQLRQEEWFPPSLKSVVFVGDDGVGNLIGYDRDTDEAILWNPADGDWVMERKASVTEMWKHIRDWYNRVAPD